MRLLWLICLALAAPRAEALPDLQRPPTPPLTNAATLAPLLEGADGRRITQRADWAKRREELRRLWTDVLGPFPQAKAPLNPEFLEREELPGFSRQRVAYQIEEGVRMDAMLLIPANPPAKLPGLVLFHPTYSNHFARAVGIEGAEPERAQAVQLVQRGYLVLAPRCFIYSELPDGWRQPGEVIYAANTRYLRQRHPDWRGLTRMTWDGIRALDFLERLPGVDSRRLGVFGHSLGAKEALYVAAFDERVRCAVFSEGGIGLRFSNWQDVWYLGPDIDRPGFAREHHELLGMIAPRPFLLLAGGSADGDASWAFIQAALPVYELLGAPRHLGWLHHHLGHRYGGIAREAAEEFLDGCLKP